ncbi:MAG: biotin-dependent carboxyltransferase family protein [Nitriliruptor sp.]
MTRTLEVLATGPLTTVQDLGRPGHAGSGVTRSGAADRAAARLANRLVGNPEGAACLEVTLGGLRVRADGDTEVAVTGARGPTRIGDRTVPDHAPFHLRPGEVLELGTPDAGLRTYLAVRGGIAVPPVLGSRATDQLGRLGPDVVAAGDRLPVGAPPTAWPPVDHAPVPAPTIGPVELRVRLGPRVDRFTDDAAEDLLRTTWRARADSNRVGLRLDGAHLARVDDGELPSEGLVRGAIQVPPGGPPTLFLADHPVTGGYPVIAVVLDADVDRAAQVRPGQHVRLRAAAASAGRWS